MSGTNFVPWNNSFQGLLCVRLIIFYFDFPTAFVTFPSTLRDWLLLFERKVTIILIEKIVSSTVFLPSHGILFISNIVENLIYFEYLKKILYFIYVIENLDWICMNIIFESIVAFLIRAIYYLRIIL